MSKTCQIVYLDQNGKMSTDYYGNLHLGHENAKKIYLERTAKHGYAKFQKNNAQDAMDFIAASKKMKLVESGDDSWYEDVNGKRYDRATHFLSKLQNPFEMENTAKLVAINNRAKEILYKDYERFGLKQKQVPGISISKIEEDYPDVLTEAKAWSESDEEAFNIRVKKILDLWDFKTEAGTEVHKVIENYIRERKNPKYTDEDGDLDVKAIRSIAMEGYNHVQYEKLLKQVESFLEKVGKGKKLTFEEEVIVSDSDLGISGSIDLLAYDEHGNVYIFDYKTKEKGKEWLFDRKNGTVMKPPAGRLQDNKQSHGELQTTLYRIMLEKAGFNVVESRILYLEADVVEYNDELKYENFNHKKDVYLKYHKTEVGKLIKQVTGFDINQGNTEVGLHINEALSALIGDDATFDEYRDMKKAVDSKLHRPLLDDDGRAYFWNYSSGSRKMEYFKSNDKNDRRRQLESYLVKEKEMQKNLSDNLIKYFNEGKKSWAGGKSQSSFRNAITKQANAILAGLDRDNFTLEKVKNISGFEGLSHDILVAINRYDGSAEVINLSRNNTRHLDIKDKQRTKDKNMFASKITDVGFKHKFGMEGFDSTDQNFKMLRSGMIAMELKRQGVISSVTNVSNGILTGRSTDKGLVKPLKLGMQNIIPQIKAMNELIPELIPENLKKILGNRTSMDERTYHKDHLSRLYTMIESDFAILSKDDKKDLQDTLYNRDLKTKDLILELIRVQTKIASNLVVEKESDLLQSMEYRLISQVILQLTNTNINFGDFSKEMAFGSDIKTTGRIAEKFINIMETRVRSTEQAIKREMNEFQREHSRLMKDLMEDRSHNKRSMNTHDLFKDLYKVDPQKGTREERARRANDLFKLKEEGSAEFNSLTKAQKAYIKFFNKNINKIMSEVLIPSLPKDTIIDKGWGNGNVPLMDAALATRREMEKDMKTKVKMSLDGMLHGKIKNTQDTFEKINTVLNSRFIQQVRSPDSRLDMMGVNYDGEVVSNDDRVMETNLEAVLARFMSEGSRQKHYEETLGIYNSINLVAMIDQNENFNSTDEVRTFAENLIKLKVFGEYKEEGKVAQAMDTANRAVSVAALGFSPRTMVMELCTNMFASGASVLQQAMSGKDKRFNIVEYSRAGLMIMGDRSKGYTSKDMSRAEAIVRQFGLYKSDSEAQARAEMQEGRKNGWFQSKWLYQLNNVPSKFFKAQSFMAELIHMGILDSGDPALRLNDEGELVYNPTKDARWKGIFADDTGKKLKDLKRPDGGYEKNKDHAYFRLKKYESFLSDMEQEDGLSEDGVPLRPLTDREVIAMKDYSMSIYGSIDKDAKLMMEATAWGRQLVKFKSWMATKKDNYWTLSHQSDIRGSRKWVTDTDHEDGGFWDFQAENVEGILQTLKHMGIGIQEAYRKKGSRVDEMKVLMGEMDPIQKENLRKLAADIIMVSLLSSLFGMLFDDDNFKKGPGKILADTANASISDLHVLTMGDNLMKSGPLVLVSYMSRAVKNLGAVVWATSTGDFEGAVESGEKMVEMTGVGKTINSFNE
jgi:hypothetical protein